MSAKDSLDLQNGISPAKPELINQRNLKQCGRMAAKKSRRHSNKLERSATFSLGTQNYEGEIPMKRKLAFIFAVPLLFCVVGFQGSCHSQCEELRQELIKDCRNDLGPNNERCREDQKRFQEVCHDESLAE